MMATNELPVLLVVAATVRDLLGSDAPHLTT